MIVNVLIIVLDFFEMAVDLEDENRMMHVKGRVRLSHIRRVARMGDAFHLQRCWNSV